MKNRLSYKALVIVLFTSAAFLSCKKQDEWLNVKSSQTDVVPETLIDLQKLADNQKLYIEYAVFGSMASDNYYATDADWAASYPYVKNSYIWAEDPFANESVIPDWNFAYQRVVYSNAILDALAKITPSPAEANQFNAIKGGALFHRALNFYEIAQLFTKPYNEVTAETDLGIVIRLNSDPNQKPVRSSVAETYARLLEDLRTAISLLPNASKNQIRPSKPAAQMLLSKVFMQMNKYDSALKYSDAALELRTELMDFNTLPSGLYDIPFPLFGKNPEIIFYAEQAQASPFLLPWYIGYVDSLLFISYNDADLRKQLFYYNIQGAPQFKGTYTAQYNFFSGLAVNELYFIRAECLARLNRLSDAMADVNTVLRKRWKKTEVYTDLSAASQSEALNIVINEKRKELPFTANIRWEDLRRLNKEPQTAVTLKRVITGVTYQLPPNDPRYVYPIPASEIKISGIAQNPR